MHTGWRKAVWAGALALWSAGAIPAASAAGLHPAGLHPAGGLNLGVPVADQALSVSSGKGLNVGPGVVQYALSANNAAGAGVVTGPNAIESGAFNGSAGAFAIVQNSGNNAVIQNAMVINLTVH